MSDNVRLDAKAAALADAYLAARERVVIADAQCLAAKLPLLALLGPGGSGVLPDGRRLTARRGRVDVELAWLEVT